MMATLTTGRTPVGTRPHWIDDWRPEDPQFWFDGGARIARHNLVVSLLSEHVGFSVWSMWSVPVLFLGPTYGFTPADKFLLTIVPTLVGSLLRLPYTCAVRRAQLDGHQRVAAGRAEGAGDPRAAPGRLAQHAAAGRRRRRRRRRQLRILDEQHQRLLSRPAQGWALGLNAGGGNLGAPVVQLVALLVLAAAGAGAPA